MRLAARSPRSALALILLMSSMAAPLTAATRTWTGTANANWTVSSNWGGTAPVAGDDLVFPAGAANEDNVNDFPAGTAFHSLTFTGDNYSLGGSRVVLGAGGINTTGGTNRINFPITLGAPQTWVLNTGSSTANLRDFDLNGMALKIACDGNSANTLSGVISGNGSITVNDSSGMNLSAVSTTTAPITLNDAGLFLNAGAYLGPITVNENGSLSVSPGATVGAVLANGPFAEFDAGAGFPTNGTANSGNIALTASADYVVRVNGATNFSALNVTGTVNLGGATLDLFTGATLIPAGTMMTIINNDGSDPITGTFDGLPSGAQFISSFGAIPQIFAISYSGGTGNDVVLTALEAATTTKTTLTSARNPSSAGQAVTFTATVAASTGTAIPTGSVDFYDDVKKLATVSLNSAGVATFITALAPGTHSIEADFNGNIPFGSSFDDLTQTVTGTSRRRAAVH